MSATKLRVEKWDNLKFFLIFLVVLGHISDCYTDNYPIMRSVFVAIYTFHMPLFLFISGLFSKKTIEQKRYDKIFSYLILYVAIKILLFATDAVVRRNFEFSLFNEGGVPWYVLALFAFCLITIGLKNISPAYVFTASVILACFVGYDSTISELLSLSRIIVYYPFFYAGYILDAKKVSEKLSNKYIVALSAIIMTVFLLVVFLKIKSVYWLRPMLTGLNPYEVMGPNQHYGIIYRFVYYIVVFIIGASVISLTPNRIAGGFFAKIGSRSVQVYSMHYVFIYVFFHNPVTYNWMHTHIPSFMLWLVVPAAMAIVLICSMKIWTPVFDIILKPKKREDIAK